MTALTFLLGALAAAQGIDDSHRRVYEKAAPSVVAVRALAPLGERSGSGVVLSADGLLLTSYAVCPEGSSNIRVWLPGPRRALAEIVAASKRDEITLLKIAPKAPLVPLELGTSAGLRLGQVTYTLGNAANSIILDDQPSFNAGVISAAYRLTEPRAGSTYAGPVFETTAAVNVGMEGAPCLDPQGRLTGLVTLNYSPSRFLGVAIPVDELKPVIDRLRRAGVPEADPTPAGGEGSLGLRLREQDGRVVVEAVDPGGPAARAGLGKGDVLLAVAGAPVKTAKDVADRLRGLEAGSVVTLRVDVEGKPEDVAVELEKAK
jgi:S1-C subfamily serine protease